VVGRGAHQGTGAPHAEAVALAAAGDRARGATLYVTLEPCNHKGRTDPCAPLVAHSGVARVVAAMRDPNPAVAGGGCRHLRDRGIEVTLGVLADLALETVWPFATTDSFRHPYVELKTAQSLDGRFAPPPEARSGTAPVYLTGDEARRDVHRRRRRVDLVLVGEGTVKADRPRLDGRLAAGQGDVPREDPRVGYVDTDLSWSGGFDREDYLVFAGTGARQSPRRAAIERDGGRIEFCRERDGRLDPAAVVERARELGLLTVMVEGGPRLAHAFLQAGLVDRWLRYQAPVVLGSGVSWPAGGPDATVLDFTATSCSRLGEDLLEIHDRRRFADFLARVSV
jgi:diaminohydroxyphosphoribosylaminopyrimidine deaminase/5-amino-6-(5-phosphoribosylamino)uracil reductase